jgi:hypothetical protein
LRTDIANPEDIARGHAQVVARFRRLDIVVNCAALRLVDPLLQLTAAPWDRVFLQPDSPSELARLVRETRVPQCASEQLRTRRAFRRLLDAGPRTL